MRDAAFEAIKAGNTAYIEALMTWNTTLLRLREAKSFRDLPASVRIAFGDPTAVVEQSFEMAAKSLELQRHLAQQWLKAWEAGVGHAEPPEHM